MGTESNMKNPYFLSFELLNCPCYTFHLTRTLSQMITLPCQVNPVDTDAAELNQVEFTGDK